MNNGVGYAPVGELQRPPQLGTDGIGADCRIPARLIGQADGVDLDQAVADFFEMDGWRTVLLGARLASYLVTPDSFDDITVRQHEVIAQLDLYPDQLQGLLDRSDKVLEMVEAMSV